MHLEVKIRGVKTVPRSPRPSRKVGQGKKLGCYDPQQFALKLTLILYTAYTDNKCEPEDFYSGVMVTILCT